MKKTIMKQFRSLVLLVSIFYSLSSFGANLNFQNSIVGANVITGYIGAAVQDNMYLPLPATPGFVNNTVKNYVKVSINHQFPTLILGNYSYNIDLRINYRDNNKNPFTIIQTLNVEYNPTAGVAYKDYSTYHFTGGHEIQVEIIAVKDANTGLIIPNPQDNINITYGINIERFSNFIPTSTVCPNRIATDVNGDGEMDQLLINWASISGAEEYELEWTYVDDYTNGTVAATKPSSTIEYDFRYNSTRVNIKDLSYKINLIYERGYVIFRVRGIGRKLTNVNTYVYGNWSNGNAGIGIGTITCGSSAYYYHSGHKSLFNWQYSSDFAEEGKKVEEVQYYDGSNRERQKVTKSNTNDTATVEESFYDFQGRKAVQALSVPASSPAITYYSNFNKNLSLNKFSREDFDKDAAGSSCQVTATGMSPTSGASYYYSANNVNSANHQTYLPNAFNFPFNQTEYTPDNTGRIRRQGGMGANHQLGSGKETKYYYGRPLQEELDRLFGSEVGYDRHYKKNVVIDPNGQVTITYYDQEDHVIATALTGNTPSSVNSVASQSTASANLNVDFFNKKSDGSSYLNVPNIDQTSLIFNTQYLVTTPGLTHSFNYNLTPQTYNSECLLPTICFDCVYDLELQIKDECGSIIYTNSVRVGSLTLNNSCGSIEYVPSGNAPAAFNIPNMAVGNYQISKVLTVNYDAYEYYLGQYLNAVNNTCFKSFETILAEEQAAMASVNCTEDCSECVESLGTSDNFVLTGKGTYQDWLNAYKECMEDCKNPSICEQTYNSMLADLSPGGQYAQWYDSLDIGGFNASSFPLSILNYNNNLPDGGLPSNNANASYWKNPKFLKKDGTTISGYYDEYGIIRSKIPVLPVSGGYFPATSSAFLSNGIYYSYPENLVNERDFVTYWQESWAKSLITYHPEYCYFKWCAPNTMDTVGSASLSSEDFDFNVTSTTSYSTATSNGWLSTGTAYAMVDLDPYFNYVSDGIAQKTAMKAQIDNYLGSGLSMKEMAALTIKCPSYYKNSSGISSTCTSFVASGVPSIDDKVWDQYKSFYYSAKQKFIRLAADDYAIKTDGSNCGKGYNGCIGVEDFNPFNSAFNRNLSFNSFTSNSSQPCYWSTYMLYKDKVRRFNIGDEMPGADKEKADFNLYYNTGLCPVDLDFAQLLHFVTSQSKLLTTFSLKTEPSFTKLIYDKIYANTTTGASYVDYNWVPTIDAMDNTKLKIEFINGGTVSTCKIDLKLPTGYTWSQVKDFGNLKVGVYNTSTSTTGFTIFAYVDHDGNPLTENLEIKVIGSTCLRLGDCQFYDQCKASDFGSKLFTLMSALANNSQLINTTAVDLEASYSPYLNRFIRNTVLSSGNTALRWKQTGSATGQFELFDVTSTGSSQNIKVNFNTFTPAFSLSDLYKIKYFTELSVDPSNVQSGFIIKAKYESSPGVLSDLTIRGDVSLGVISGCYEPVPVECETKEHQAAKDLEALITGWLSNQPIAPGLISNSNSYTELLETYIGLGHHTNLENIVVNTDGLTADINVYNASSVLLNSCGIKMYHLSPDYTNNFNTITSVESFWVDYTMQTSNRNYHFKMKVIYSNGDQEVIGGYTTCIPIRSCLCEEDDFEGYGLGCNDKAKLTMDAITKYNINFWGNNPGLLNVPQIAEADYICDCGNDYIKYLETYDNSIVKPMSYLEYTVNNCQIYSQSCSDYKKYFNTVTEFNKNNPGSPLSIINILTFPCNCVDAYVDYLISYKLVPQPNPMPAMDLFAFIANGCKGNGPGSGLDGCSYPGLALSYYNSAVNACNDYNSQVPAPVPLLSMPPFNPSIDCNCYLKYAIYLAAGKPYSYPNPAKSFALFQAQGCVDNDCWGEYEEMIAQLENQATLSGNNPPYSPPAYDPSKCNCYSGYSWYVQSNYGVNMLSIDEWCEQNGSMALMVFGGNANSDSSNSNSEENNEESNDSLFQDASPKIIIPLQEPMSFSYEANPNIKNLAYRAACPKDTLISLVLEDDGDPCETFKNNQAIYNAKKRYEDQILSMTSEFRNAYYTKCLSLTENFTGVVPTKDYHYTLNFYNQAGNLVASVPPSGVKLIDLSVYGTKIKLDREKKTKSVYNTHFLKSTYEYNSLDQVTRQSFPDHNKMDVWNVSNSSNILSTLNVTDVQFVSENVGFAVANNSSGYAYIYKTTDAGITWSRLDPGTADLKKVVMYNSNDGYALGNDGLLLRTFDGGVNWNLITINVTTSPAPISGICTKHLNDIVALDPNTIIVVGDEGTIIKCIWSGSAWTFTNMAGTLLVNSTMNITSITPDVFGAIPNYARCYVTVNIPSASSNANRIFLNTNTFGGTSWSDLAINTKLKASDLKSVYMIDDNNGFACGVNGGLFKTTNAGALWTHIATSTNNDFSKLYFKDINNGIVLAADGNLYSTTNGGNAWTKVSAIGTYNDLYFHDRTNGKGFAAGNAGLLSYIDFANISNGKLVKKYITPTVLADDFGAVGSSSATDVFMGSKTGNTVYKAVITGDKVKYTSIGIIAGVTGFKKAVFASSTQGAFLTSAGKVYNCQYSGSYSFTNISHAGSNYSDITKAGSNLYAINNAGNTSIYKSATPWTSVMALQGGTNPEVTTAFAETSINLVSVGTGGSILVFSQSGMTYTSNTLKTEPLKLKDIYAVPTTGLSSTNTVFACGVDGTLLKTVDAGTTWQTLNSLTSQELNALVMPSTTDGLVAGNNGTVVKLASGVLTLANTGISSHLNDLSYNLSSTRYSLIGQSKTFIQTINGGTSFTKIVSPGSSSENYLSINDFGSTQTIVAQNGNIYKYTGGTWSSAYKLPYALNALHINKSNGLGMIVGNNSTTLYSNNYGNTWILNKPTPKTSTTYYTFTGVAVWNSSNIYATALSSIPIRYNDLQASSNTALSGSGITAVNWNDVVISESGKGYIGGASNKHAYFTAGSTSCTIGSNTGTPGTYVVNSISIGIDKAFFVCNNGLMFSADMTTNTNSLITSTVSANLLKISMYDDKIGYVVGANGTVLRIWDQNGAVKIDNLSGRNNNGTAVTSNIQAIDYNTRNHLVFAGAFGHIKNAISEKQYTSFFWYDQLGRMVVSQNTKQYKKAVRSYGYTLYDDIGRIIEVGEISQLNPIFDQYIDKKLDQTLFNSWISSGNRTEITHTYYDEQFASTGMLIQNNLRKRVASVTYEESYDGNPSTYQTGTHYSYDIHGNINHMTQEINESTLLSTGLNVKHFEYEYDLISDKLNLATFNAGNKDQYFQKYEYDADNEIVSVKTSRDGIWWDNDASYTYYNNDPLARLELGDLKVQGIDYAYTIHGWNKGVNSNTLNPNRDMGRDGVFGGQHQYVAKDVFGYSFGYFTNDYQDIRGYAPLNKFEASVAGSDLMSSRVDIWNGKISHMVTTLPDINIYNASRNIAASVRGTGYRYDQLNRLLEARSYSNINTVANQWQSGGGISNGYYEGFGYDAMGNLSSLNRWGSAAQMDNLTYQYNKNGVDLISNKLYAVTDLIPAPAFTNDIDNQAAFVNALDSTVNFINNYGYDDIGNLIRDNAEEIQDIKWTISSKLKSITRTPGSTKPDVEFIYDPSGNLCVEIIKPKPLNPSTYRYNYQFWNGSNNRVADYEYSANKLNLKEIVIYGEKRIGTDNRKLLLWDNGSNLSALNTSNSDRILGSKQYELSNHLGNVLVSVTDKKIPKSNGGGLVDYFEAEITTITDYYAFGYTIGERSWADPNLKYRFGYNGMKNQDDCNCGETYQTTFRLYNSRLGRWWSMDPKMDEYRDFSPYVAMENDPISESDPDGDCPWCIAFIKGAVQEYATQVITNLASGKSLKQSFTQVNAKAILTAAVTDAITLGVGSLVKKASTVVAVAKAADKANDTKKAVATTSKVANTSKTVSSQSQRICTKGADGIGCFIKGTLILTSRGYKPIESIRVGDTVWAYNEKTGKVMKQVVYRTFTREVGRLITLYINGKAIVTTEEHPFFVNNKWVKAKDLLLGDSMLLFNGQKMVIQRIFIKDTNTRVYNFAVRKLHNYFVSDLQVLSHNNAKLCGTPKPNSVGLPKPNKGKGQVPPSQRDPKRTYTTKEREAMLTKQDNKCVQCGQKKTVNEVEGHHKVRHADGGKTDLNNGAAVCKDCHKKIHK